MKLRVFQSDQGDCLLLEGGGKRVLVDGGMAGSYTTHVAPVLTQLREDDAPLDVVYVSHIDRDHISGVLKMVDDLVDWRAFDFQQRTGNTRAKQPPSPRPPEIGAIWHNAFHEAATENAGDVRSLLAASAAGNAGEIQSLLAASAAVLSGSEREEIFQVAQAHQELATSVAEAIQLSRRVGDGQLNIPLNPEFEGRLMMVDGSGPEVIELGGLRMTLLGPFAEDLEKLRGEWNAWLADNRKRLEQIRERADRDRERIGTEAGALVASARFQADDLARLAGLEAMLAAGAGKLGERRNVTTPNLASLMFLAEEGRKSVLLTGDGHWADILKGLERAGKLDGGGVHVSVLKVQHHGAEHNISQEFCRRVTADHYVFCGNGAHGNPDERVVKLIAEERFAADGGPFTFWFNSHQSVAGNTENAEHMGEVEKLVRELSAGNGRLRFRFLKTGFFDLKLGKG